MALAAHIADVRQRSGSPALSPDRRALFFLETWRIDLMTPHSQHIRHLFVILSAVLFGCLQQAAVCAADVLVPGIADRITVSDPADRDRIAGGAPDPVTYTWMCGDRSYSLAGRELKATDRPLTFRFHVPRADRPLTLELWEFRRSNDGRVAYLVEANGQRIQFRNRKYEGAGPSSAFIDIPNSMVHQPTITVRLTNLCDNPICFSSAILYDDLEGYARSEGLVQPMYVGPIVDGVLDDPAKMKQLREILPDTPDVKPMFSLCTLAAANWTPETVERKLDRLIASARELNAKAEVQAITWWGGTPSGCDGIGGRWNDVTYQQVTYVPGKDRFGLSVPNVWSNTPWLTVGNQRLNGFKADCFARFGRMVRDRYEQDPANFPLISIVLDNEPTYWAAGNPGAAPDQLADFNLAMVESARKQGVTLDPRDGLGPDEKGFLRRALLDYNREMNAGIRRGLGECALSERVFTHTFMATVNGLFEDFMQATGVGVIRTGRLGGEWMASLSLLPALEQHRELGIPAGINREAGGGQSVLFDVDFAYAMGCDHLTLFNVSDDKLAEIAPSLKGGWQEIKPTPWRPVLFSTDHFRTGAASLAKYFVETQGVATEPWPGQTFGVRGDKPGVSSRALVRLSSRELTGKPVFDSLALRYDARAFVWDFKKGGSVDNPDGYLAVRAGPSRDRLTEVDRMFNGVKKAGDRIDLSAVARGAKELWVEFEFHPIRLPGWVMLFNVELERPWAEENLLYTNRSYRADRLRVESSIVGWRADASWALTKVQDDAATWPAGDPDLAGLTAVRSLFAAGSYQKAYRAVRAIVERRARPPEAAPWALSPDRQEHGELASADPAAIRFEPYDGGYCDAVVKLAPDAAFRLEENGMVRPQATVKDVLPGDDVTLEVKGNRAVSVVVRRGTASGKVTTCTAMTPYAMPILAEEGGPGRPLSYRAKIGNMESFRGWKVGYQPAQPGDNVSIRWNPTTGRIVEVEQK